MIVRTLFKQNILQKFQTIKYKTKIFFDIFMAVDMKCFWIPSKLINIY